MSTKRLLAMLVVAGLVMLAVGAGPRVRGNTPASPPAQTPDPNAVTIPYSGTLTDDTGRPVPDEAYAFAFALYDADTDGEPLWTETQEGVTVKGGAFATLLGSTNAIPRGTLDGGDRWLEVAVRGPGETEFTALSPRQRVSAVSSAMSPGTASTQACPHNHWGEAWSGSRNGLVLYGNSDNYATLYAEDQSPNGGYGVYGRSTKGIGVFGQASGASGANYGVLGESKGANGYGVYGQATATSGTNYGLYGRSTSTGGTGVFGRATATSGTTYGVYGRSDSTSGIGVYGKASAASGYTYGVYGEAQSDNGYAGYFKNTYGNGVYVKAGDTGVYVDSAVTSGVEVRSAGNNGVSVGSADRNGVLVNSAGIHGFAVNSAGGSGLHVGSAVDSGVYVQSAGKFGVRVFSAGQDGVYAVGNAMGVTGETTRADNLYGLFTVDYAFANTYHSLHGMMQVMQNGGSEPLEAGDVVVFSGIGAPVGEDSTPMVQVTKATAANSTGVAGVVVSRYNPPLVQENAEPGENSISPAEWDYTPNGPVPPGGYLLVVVQGQAQVKANAVAGAIQPGDLLSTAAQAGYAAKAAEVSLGGVKMALPGTVFGKALEPLEASQETGLVWVWVALQ